MKKLIFLPAIIATALTSCGGDDEQTYVLPQTYLVTNEKQIDLNDNSVLAESEFEYDGTNRLVSEMSQSQSKTFVYGSNGKISKMINGVGAPMRETIYTYDNNGRLTGKQRNHPASNSVEVRYEYTYFTDRYEEKQITIDNEVYRNKYYYTPDKKNIAKVENYYNDNDFYGSKEFLYDDKTGTAQLAPYSQMPEPFYNFNNVVTQTNKNTANVILFTIESNIEYDGLGHPTSITAGSYKRTFDYVVK